MKQPIQLSDHFGYRRLLRFTFPSMVMMVFTSIYSVVDGVFVSNFVGKTPFAAINLVMPMLMLLGIVGFMIGTGGSALIAKTLGEGDREKANRIFSMLVMVGLLSGLAFGIVGYAAVKPVAALLGADGALLADCTAYGRIILSALPFFILQNMFQALLVTAERPNIGLTVTVVSGVLNIVLDLIFIVVLGWGLKGSACATALSMVVGGLVPVA